MRACGVVRCVCCGVMVLVWCAGGVCSAAEGGAATGAEVRTHAEQENTPHPIIDGTNAWAGAMVWGILGMFVTAAIVGLVTGANVMEEMPPTHSHDEPPGESGHHGRSGTVQPEPGGH